jgi:hypothetical protein
MQFATYGTVIKEDYLEISTPIAAISVGYEVNVVLRKRQLKRSTAQICAVFERMKALEEFPRGIKVPLPILLFVSITVGFVVGLGFKFFTNQFIALGASVFSVLVVIGFYSQIEGGAAAVNELQKIYAAILNYDFSKDFFVPKKEPLGFWGFPPYFLPLIVSGILYVTFTTAENLGFPVDNATEINFAFFAATSLIYYIINEDISRQIDAKQERYAAASKAFDMRKKKKRKKIF